MHRTLECYRPLLITRLVRGRRISLRKPYLICLPVGVAGIVGNPRTVRRSINATKTVSQFVHI